jgi:hypothetical protein
LIASGIHSSCHQKTGPYPTAFGHGQPSFLNSFQSLAIRTAPFFSLSPAGREFKKGEKGRIEAFSPRPN